MIRTNDVSQTSMTSILVIEDDADLRLLIVNALTDAGYVVLGAADGRAGIDVYSKTQTDLVITDLVMPEKDGLEVITHLRSNFPDVKIIAISGGGKYGGKDSYLRLARAFTVTRTLGKPFGIGELLEAVREVLEEKP